MRSVISALALVALSGCSVMVNGPRQTIPVTSSPAGAAVSARCGASTITAETPAKIEVPRRAMPCEITISKDGYQPRVVSLDRRRTRAFWANLWWIPALMVIGFAGGEDCDDSSFICFERNDTAVGGAIVGAVPAAIGMGIDAGSGAMYHRGPPSIDVTLQPRE